jgi:hypothetical protein
MRGLDGDEDTEGVQDLRKQLVFASVLGIRRTRRRTFPSAAIVLLFDVKHHFG